MLDLAVADASFAGQTQELLLELCARFAPERARGIDCLVEWCVRADGGLDRFQLAIRRGTCALAPPKRRPDVALDLSLEDLTALVEGDVTGGDLFARQHLVISGDVLMASRLPGLFGEA